MIWYPTLSLSLSLSPVASAQQSTPDMHLGLASAATICVCFFNLCFPACVNRLYLQNPSGISSLSIPINYEPYTKKPNGTSKGLGEANQPASQPGRCEMSSLFIHHMKTNFKLMLCRWPPLSVCLSIHPSRKDHNCKMRVCQYVWTR